MSEQEKKSSGSALEGSVMMVDNTPGGRLKPYRPNELQNSTDYHQKHSRAPIVLSVAEEMKCFTEDCSSSEMEIKKRKEYEEVQTCDKEKQNFAKKKITNTERREKSPESIMLQSTELDKKKGGGTISPLAQPIPDVQSTTSGLTSTEKEAAKVDGDSITEEVEELQTPEVAKKHSEWSDDEEAGGLPRSDSRASRVSRMKAKSSLDKKKQISWNSYENITDVEAKKSDVCILGRKASVGPCFKNMAPNKGPSGITICLPKKSLKCVAQSSGVSVNISRKGLGRTKSTANEISAIKLAQTAINIQQQSEMVKNNVALMNFFDSIKDKVSNVQSKIKSFFHS